MGGVMFGRTVSPALMLVSLVVLAGVFAPTAGALPSCQDAGTTSTCRTNGSVSIKARPGTVAAPANQPGIRWGGGSGLSLTFGR